jgi:lipid-A-disaccharide synthase
LSRRVFIVAAESSGDGIGADLAQALRALDPTLEFTGVGGQRMADVGMPSQADISGLAILGLLEGVYAYDRVKEAVAATVEAIVAAKPDAVVLIDSWGFMLRVARGVRARAPEIKLIKYVGPQVWATRAGRAKTLAAAVDHLICIQENEPPYYKPYGLECTVSGHPVLGRNKKGDAAGFRARHKFNTGDRILLVLPGSRAAEIRRIGPTLWAAAEMLKRDRSDVRLVVVAAEAVRDHVLAQMPHDALAVDEVEKEDAFAAATVALAASGTVTTEVALQHAPVVVAYRLDPVSGAIARWFLFKGKYVTLMNIAANTEVAPEILQTQLTPENVAAAAAPLLDNAAARDEQVRRQDDALAKMGRGGRPAAEIAAEAVLKVMRG